MMNTSLVLGLVLLTGLAWTTAEEEALGGAPSDLEGILAKEEELQPVARAIRSIVFGDPDVPRTKRQVFFPGQGGGSGQGGNFAGQGGNIAGQGGSGQCNCAPHVACAAELEQITQSCTLRDGSPAVCCPQRFLAALTPVKGTGDDKIITRSRLNVQIGDLDDSRVNQACEKGANAVNGISQTEKMLVSNNVILPRGSPAANHLRVFKVSNRVKRQDNNALTIAMASRNMVNDFSLTSRQGSHGLKNLRVSNTVLSGRCPENPRCSDSKYRTTDGSCNNQRNTAWGMSSTPLQRILPPAYGDGLMSPRTSGVDGTALPNERLIASNILVDVDNPDLELTSSVMQWAQFMDHDLVHTPFPSLDTPRREGIDCCPNGQIAPNNMLHPRCWPIDVSRDTFYRTRGVTCMNFVRSMLAVGSGAECTFGYAEQVNALTHWIDGSNVYGSDAEEEEVVRLHRNGLLKTSGNNMLPINPDQGGDCEASNRNAKCFVAGDSRVNEQPGLTAIHTVWMREHNRIARDLQTLNPSWSDDAVYQEARRIVIAEMQHITYNEWLPIIVGPRFMQSFGISVRSSGFSFDYNPNFNPNINNEFSTAAFRFGHTLVQGTLRLFTAAGGQSAIQLRDNFNSPHFLQQTPGALDMIIRSWAQLAIQKFDSFITEDLTNHLFQTPRFNFGMDLMSLNIHRGRDHGIATYNDVRAICGLQRASSFQDITDQIPGPIATNLARIYKSVDDIDFFVGGMAERPVSGGLLGWTFLCVVGDQFARLKKGDRYFYDLGGQAGSFREDQLQEIRRSSWARILCDNSDNVQSIQPLAFQQGNSRFNQPVACNSPQIPRPNLQLWRGERTG